MGKNEKTEADIGDNVTLQCTWDANPVPRVRWTREGDDVALAQSDTLTLENVQQTDSGSYECQASVANVSCSPLYAGSISILGSKLHRKYFYSGR